MADFSLTAKLNLLRPANIDSVSSFIRNKLENINVRVKTSIDKSVNRDLANINRSFRQTRREVDLAADSMEAFGKQTAITIRRFGAYTLVTAGFFRFIRSVNQGVKEAITFQDELVKIAQVTGESLFGLRALTGEINRLSTSLGVSSTELLNASMILAQAGLSAREARIALQALAKSDLAPTFDNINKTAEASIAITRQFGISIYDLEKALSSVNAVSAKFAVESADITAAIQRTGGAFAAAGGSLEELMALFTSVRSTTRESAETIATGFRTIFTRLQRTRTQNFLSDLGVDLREVGDEARRLGKEGLFVGPYKAIQRLSEALNQLDSSDPRFAQIVEELGGFRQISKVIPLVQQFATAENALGVAMRGTTSLTEDAEKRQQSLAIQIKKVREEFQVLLRQFGDSSTFKIFADITLELTRALIRLGSTLERLSPALITVFGPRLATSIKAFVGGMGSKIKSKTVLGFAEGGIIPGFGNKDSELIAAMPGEFVINKRSVKKIGLRTLQMLNDPNGIPKFATGGLVGNKVVNAAALGGIGTVALGGLTAVNDEFKKLSVVIGTFALQFASLNTILTASNDKFDRLGEKVENLIPDKLRFETKLTGSRENLSKTQKDALNAIAKLEKRRERLQFQGDPKKIFQDIDSQRERMRRDYVSAQRSLSYLQTGDAHKYKDVNLEKIFNRDMQNLNKQAEDVYKTISDIENTNKAIEAEKEKIDIAKKIVESDQLRLDRVNKLQTGYQRQIVLMRNLNTILSGTAATAMTLSSVFKDMSDKTLSDAREGKTVDKDEGRRNAGLSGAGSGLGVGVLSGLGIAPALKSLGLIATINPAISVAVAGLFGLGLAAYNAVSSMKEFDKELKLIDINRASEELGNRLKEISEGANPRVAAASINQRTRFLRRGLITETDSNLRESLNANIDGAIDGLINFVKQTQSVSSSLDDLKSVVSLDTLSIVADRTGKTLSQYLNELEQGIIRQAKYNEGLEKSIQRNRQFEIGIISQRALDMAAKTAAASLNDLSGGLGQVFGGEGLNLGKAVSNAFSEISAGAGIGSANGLQSFAGNFGDAASRLAKDSLEAAKAIEILPNILLKMRSADPLGDGTGDFSTRLALALDNANIGTSVKNAILDQVANIIGPEGQDQSIIDQINKDFLAVFESITSKIVERNQGIFSSLEESTNSALEQFAAGLEKSTKYLEQITATRLNILDNRKLFESIRSSVNNTTDFNALRNIESQRINIFTNGKSIQRLFEDLNRAESNQISLRDSLPQTQDLEERQRIISAISKEEREIVKATRALSELANASERTAIAQKQLEKETAGRSSRRNLALDMVFSGPQELAQQRMIIHFSRILDATGDINQIPVQFAQEVKSFLQGLGDTRIPGLSSTPEEILNKTLRNTLTQSGVSLEGILTPNDKEKQLISEITKTFSESEAIQTRLNEEREKKNNLFITDLNTRFSSFIDNLRAQIDRIFDRERETRSESIRGDIISARATLGKGNLISQMTGLDPQTVFNNFENISNLTKQAQDITAVLSSLSALKGNLGIFRSSSAATMADSKGSGLELVENFINEIRASDSELAEILTREFNSGGFKDIISRLDDFIKATPKVITDSNVLAYEFGKQFSSLSENIFRQQREELSKNKIALNEMARSLGGEGNLRSVINNIQNLRPIIDSLPSATNFSKLEASINSLTKELNQVNSNRIGRNSGGLIPGYGTKDNVPALLTKGEYVINARAVKKYGIGLFDSLNSGTARGFKSGGSVGRKFEDILSSVLNLQQSRFNLDYQGPFNGIVDNIGSSNEKSPFSGLRDFIENSDKYGWWNLSDDEILRYYERSNKEWFDTLSSSNKSTLVDTFRRAEQKKKQKMLNSEKYLLTREEKKRFRIGSGSNSNIRLSGLDYLDAAFKAQQRTPSTRFNWPESKMSSADAAKLYIAKMAAQKRAIKALAERDAMKGIEPSPPNIPSPVTQSSGASFEERMAAIDAKNQQSRSSFNDVMNRSLTGISDLRQRNRDLEAEMEFGYPKNRSSKTNTPKTNYNFNMTSPGRPKGKNVVPSPQNLSRPVQPMNNIPNTPINRSQENLTNTNMSNIGAFNAAINTFNSTAQQLAKSFANIPSEISMKANHRVELIVNGAQVLAEIHPSIVKLVEKTAESQMNKFIDQKFPEVGRVM